MAVPAWLSSVFRYFGGKTAADRLAGRIALIVASNQPFYPLYAWFLLGERAWPSLLTWLSTPLFLAVPWLGRRRGTAAAARLLLVAGIGNTLLCGFALGTGSFVELFYLPCLLLAALLPVARSRLAGVGAAGLAVLACAAALRLPAETGLVAITPAETASLVTLNAVSVAGLTLLIAVTAFRDRDAAPA